MSRHSLSDSQVEALMSGRYDEPEFADLARALDGIRSLRSMQPSTPADELVARAARIAAGSAPAPRPRLRPRRVWRLAPALASAALAMTLIAPLAVMANTASPGDLLYGFDRFFERIGIGDGGFAERLLEAKDLHARGRSGLAAEHLAAAVTTAGPGEIAAHMSEVTMLVGDLTVANPGDPEAVSALASLALLLGDEVDGDGATRTPGGRPGNDPVNGNPSPGPDNPNQGPGNNSGNGNTAPGAGNDNPNSGPSHNSGNGNTDPGQGNPNAGPGSHQGQSNANAGPGNNSGNGNADPGQEDPTASPGNDSPGQPPAGEPDESETGGGQSGGGNPNKGPGHNSGNGKPDPGQGNPNQGPGNNNGKGKN